MKLGFLEYTDAAKSTPSPAFEGLCVALRNVGPLRQISRAILLVILTLNSATMQAAHADGFRRGTAAYSMGDYVRAVKELSPLAQRGDGKALALLGFMYEHGFGAPRAYDVAADLYARSAARGNPLAQSLLGLMYDKGHGVPQNVVLAYMWLNLAAARGSKHERLVYSRLRDAVSSKMTSVQIIEGQRLALNWAPGRW